MYDLALINSPIHDYSSYPRYQSSYSTPVGLLYLATVAKRSGFNPVVLDAERLQLAPFEIAREINGLRPRFVGFNAFSINFSIVERVMAALSPDLRVVVGGPHVSLMNPGHFENTLERADILVKNDGELTIVDILQGERLQDIPGILYRDDFGALKDTGQPREVDLDSLPIPDRSLISGEPYSRDGQDWVDISISRGCVFRCKFCAGSCKSNGTTYRRRALDRVVNEIHYLVDDIAVEAIQIVDDLPFNGLTDLDTFLDLLEANELRLSWEINMPLQFLKSLSNMQILRLVECGVKKLTFGIESGSFEARKAVGKNARDDDIISLVTRLAAEGISAKGYFVLGFPGESMIQMETTVSFAHYLNSLGTIGGKEYFSPRIFMFKPMPGSALWKQLLLSGHTSEEMLGYGDFLVDSDYFKKHAWGTPVKYSEVEPEKIQAMINSFYNKLAGT